MFRLCNVWSVSMWHERSYLKNRPSVLEFWLIIHLFSALAAERGALEEQSALRKVEEAQASANRSLELAMAKRQRAQSLMGNADLAAYRATMALRIAEAAQVVESPDVAAAHFLD